VEVPPKVRLPVRGYAKEGESTTWHLSASPRNSVVGDCLPRHLTCAHEAEPPE
jgi:hypothetical protein